MPEGMMEGGKILGMPRKVAIPVLGVAAIVVVYMLIRGRSGGGAIPRMQPEQGGDTGAIGGGGGGGYPIPAITGVAPTNPIQEALDRLYFDREQFQYNIEQRQEHERQAEFEIAHEEKRSTLEAFQDLLPFQFATERERQLTEQAGLQTERSRLGYFEELFETERAGQEVVQRSIARKSKVECPKGMHFVVTADGGGACQPLGGGGFNFSTITKGIANVVTGIFQGAAQAAPGIGAGAAQYGAAQIGIIPGRTSKPAPVGTPGINPEPFDASPYRFTGSTDLQYGGLG